MAQAILDFISTTVLAAVIAISVRGCIESTEPTAEVFTDVRAYQ